MITLASSIYHPRWDREAAVFSPVPVVSPAIKIQRWVKKEQEKISEVILWENLLMDGWVTTTMGSPQIYTFSALFMDDKAREINKGRAGQALYLFNIADVVLAVAGRGMTSVTVDVN